MDYRQNLAEVLRAVKEAENLSLTKLAKKLEISRSQLVEFLKENGNPRMDTFLLIAKKLKIDPAKLLAPPIQTKEHQVLEPMLHVRALIRLVAPRNRRAFLDHFTQMVLLMENDR